MFYCDWVNVVQIKLVSQVQTLCDNRDGCIWIGSYGNTYTSHISFTSASKMFSPFLLYPTWVFLSTFLIDWRIFSIVAVSQKKACFSGQENNWTFMKLYSLWGADRTLLDKSRAVQARLIYTDLRFERTTPVVGRKVNSLCQL